MRNKTTFIILYVLIFFFSSCKKQSSDPLVPTDLDFSAVDKVLADSVPVAFDGKCYVVIHKDGQAIYQRSIGGYDGNTKQLIASCSKWLSGAVLMSLVDEGKIKLKDSDSFKGKKITYHDSCYLGRGNGIYEAPRKVLEALDVELVEMNRCGKNGLCCGAGGAQMFKEEEKGNKRINWERAEEAIGTGSQIIAAACPFCNTMLTDGVKGAEKEGDVKVLDIAELVAASLG